MDFRHLIVTCLFSKLRLPFDNQKVKENYAILYEKPQEFKQKTPGISIVNPWGLFSYNPDYTINAATSAKIA